MPSQTRKQIGLVMWLQSRQRQRAATAERARRKELARRMRQWKGAWYACMQALLFEERRSIARADNGWQGSTMHGYLEHGDDITYKQKFRVTRATFDYIHEKLQSTGYIKDSNCRNSALRISARFKVAVSLYFLAHGCCDTDMVGDVASLGASTVELYLKMFCDGVLQVLRPIYMPATPPSEAQLTSIKAEFAKRRGKAARQC